MTKPFDYWNPGGAQPEDENAGEGNGVPGRGLNMEGMFPQGLRTQAEMGGAKNGTQSDVALHVGMTETLPVGFKELPQMPTPEAAEAGLEVLLAEGGATVLCEADPENGQYFSTIELDFSTMSSDERAAIAMNPFVRSLAISREKTFRGTGEGTGDVDWNDIDCDVRQTVTWDPEAKMIVAGSRMAVPAETIDQETFFKSLYKYEGAAGEKFENEVIKKYFELGRTFINDAYGHFLREEKKSGKPGVEELVAAKGDAVRLAVFQGVWLQVQKLKQDPKNKDIKGLMGAVSIDGRYTDEALQRIVTLITQRFPMAAVLPKGAHFEPRQEMEPVVAGEFSNDEKWNTTADFGMAMKRLKRVVGKMTAGDKAIFPRLLQTYAGFVDEPTAVGFGNAVKNPFRFDANGRPCVELALFLDLEHVSEATEKDHAPQGAALPWQDSLRHKFGGTAWQEMAA